MYCCKVCACLLKAYRVEKCLRWAVCCGSPILYNHQEAALGEPAPHAGTGSADGIDGRDALVHYCLYEPPRALLFVQVGLLDTSGFKYIVKTHEFERE